VKPLIGKPVANTPNRLQINRICRIGFQFRSQPAHMYVECAGIAEPIRRLDFIKQPIPSDDLAEIGHQQRQDLELLLAQDDFLPVPRDRMRLKIKRDFADGDPLEKLLTLIKAHPAQHCPYMCLQFLVAKWFDEIVIRAKFQAFDTVGASSAVSMMIGMVLCVRIAWQTCQPSNPGIITSRTTTSGFSTSTRLNPA
jgi:hypothetical protein